MNIESYYPKIYKTVCRCVPFQNTEDVTQEIFLNAWRSRNSFDGLSAFETWLTTIMERKIADYFRKEYRHEAKRLRLMSSAQSKTYETYTDIEMDDILGHINDKYAVVLRMVFCDDITQTEIARKLGITYDAMRRRYRNGLKQVRKLLEGRSGGIAYVSIPYRYSINGKNLP